MRTIATIALAACAGVALGTGPAAAQKITFTLNWVAGGDHAPYFYAQKQGLYKQAGLDVNFETGRGSAMSAQKVGAGQSQLGLSDMANVLLFRGKGADNVGLDERLCQLAAGHVLAEELRHHRHQGFRRQEDRQPGRRRRPHHVAGTRQDGRHRPEFRHLGEHRRQLQAERAEIQTVDVTTSFFNLHHVFARELGDDMGFLAWKDAGVNPYGNSIIANAAWLKGNRDKADKFIKITQKAFADCVTTPSRASRR